MPIFKKTSAAKTAMILLLIGCSSTPKIGESSATSIFSNNSSAPGSSEVTSALTSAPLSSNEVISSGTGDNDSSSTHEEIPIEETHFDIEFVDGGVAIKDYDLNVNDLIIPDSIENNPVVAINEGAFAGGAFESVTIPSSVTTIGAGAFQDCDNLTSMSVPFVGESRDSNQFLGYIFGAEDYLNQNDYIPESLHSISFAEPDNTESAKRMSQFYIVTSIPAYSFYGCASINTIILPPSITEIGNYAFYNTGVETFTIPASVTIIHSSIFVECKKLLRINMLGLVPPTLATNALTLLNANTLIKVPVAAENTYKTAPVWSNYANIIYSDSLPYYPYQVTFSAAGAKIVSYEGNESNLVIPATFNSINVVEIGDGVFYEKRLSSVSMPDTIQKIGRMAFARNYGLTSITLPNNLLVLEELTFSACYALTSIILPNSLQEIQSLSLDSTKISTLNIPSSVSLIGIDLFGIYSEYYSSITNIFVDPANPYYSDIDGVLYDKTGMELVYFPFARTGNFTLASSTRVIKEYSFLYTQLSELIFNQDVYVIKSNAFYNSNLVSVTLSERIQQIEGNPFVYSYLLEEFILPREPDTVGYFFLIDSYGALCSGQNDTVGRIIAYPAAKVTPHYTMQPTTLTVVSNAFIGANIQVLETSDSLEYATFSLTDSTVKELILSKSVMQFNNSEYNSLAKITVDPDNPWLADVDGVLFDKDLSVLIVFPTKYEAATYAIPDGVTIIAQGAFYNVQLDTLIIPASIIEIHSAFIITDFENLKLISVIRMIGVVPPTVSGYLFDNLYLKTDRSSTTVVEVPNEAFDAYSQVFYILASCNGIIGY